MLKSAATGEQPTVTVGNSLESLEELAELSNRIYGVHPDMSQVSYHRWLYEANPLGKAIRGSARLSGKMVAHYAVIPTQLRINDEDILAGLGVNALVDRNAQGRGLFAKLVSEVDKAAAAQGLKATYVIPGPESEPWFRTVLRYQEAGELALFVRPERIARAAARSGTILELAAPVVFVGELLLKAARALKNLCRSRSKCEVRLCSAIGGEFDEFWNRIASSVSLGTVRSSAFLQWRYGDAPTRKYGILQAYIDGRMAGFIVYRSRTTRHLEGIQFGSIVDLVVEPTDRAMEVALELLTKAVSRLAERNISAIIFQLSGASNVTSAVRKAGFWPLPKRRDRWYRPVLLKGAPQGTLFASHFTGGDYDMG